jgi:ribosomal-protein-alanine N-acetyltransferase
VGISNIVRGAFQAAYLGYHMAEKSQGKGYMSEALREVIDFAFTALNLHRLMANYRPENLASGRVLEKLNFVKEGLAKNYLLVNGQWSDHILTSLTNPHWKPD